MHALTGVRLWLGGRNDVRLVTVHGIENRIPLGMHRSVENVEYAILHSVRNATQATQMKIRSHSYGMRNIYYIYHFLPSSIPYGNNFFLHHAWLGNCPVNRLVGRETMTA